jgi:hypothetical protein
MKKMFLQPFKFLDSLVDRVFAVIGAMIFVQFPQFYSQYIQRLGGHLDEAGRAVHEYTKTAASNNLTLTEYIKIHLTSHNNVFVSTGKLINDFIERLQHLESSIAALNGAWPWNRWWLFLKELDLNIANQTLANYTLGIPTTIEALIYALIGLILFFSLYQGVKCLILLIACKIVPSKTIPRKPTLSSLRYKC